MSKGYGYEAHAVLNKAITANPSKGVQAVDLKNLIGYHIKKEKLDIANRVNTNSVIEMYLICREVEHEFVRNKAGYIISGVTYKNDNVRNLIETLNMGIEESVQTAQEAAKLYKLMMEG